MADQAPAKESASARFRRRHAARLANGLCTRCGKAPPEPGLKVCGSCGEKGNHPMGRYTTDLAFERAAPDEVRIYRDGRHIGDIYKDEDILEPGRFHYLIWLLC